MTKILDKKEQVIDFKLTPYGRFKLSSGRFKPVYYAFYDVGIVYDGDCAGIADEDQNDINVRIKDETHYLATQALFGYIIDDPGKSTIVIEDVEEVWKDAELVTTSWGTQRWVKRLISAGYRKHAYFPFDVKPEMNEPAADFFKFDAAIGDAHFDGPEQRAAPAWKVVTLDGQISGSHLRDSAHEQDIPQIDITLNYVKSVDKRRFIPDPDSVYEIIGATPTFSDDKLVRLKEDNLLIYTEELNTDLLTENFEIEVFHSASDNTLRRKFFEKHQDQVINGYMVSSTQPQNSFTTLTTSSVEYYFDIFTDQEVSQAIACRGASVFNRNSYYIDIDFDCDKEEQENTYYDIYGSAITEEEIEICQS